MQDVQCWRVDRRDCDRVGRRLDVGERARKRARADDLQGGQGQERDRDLLAADGGRGLETVRDGTAWVSRGTPPAGTCERAGLTRRGATTRTPSASAGAQPASCGRRPRRRSRTTHGGSLEDQSWQGASSEPPVQVAGQRWRRRRGCAGRARCARATEEGQPSTRTSREPRRRAEDSRLDLARVPPARQPVERPALPDARPVGRSTAGGGLVDGRRRPADEARER